MNGHSNAAPARLMTVAQAQETLGGISRRTFYRLVKENGLPIVKLRGRSFVRLEDIDALISRSLSDGHGQAA